MSDRLAEIEARLAESPDCSWPQPWGMEAEVKGDGHWDNECHVNTEGGEGSHLATFQYRCHAEMFAALATDLRDLLAVAKAAREFLQAHDEADGEMDWTGPTVDTLLRAALANLERGA